MRFKTNALAILLLSNLFLHSQNRQIDSLKHLVTILPSDTQKVNVYNSLAAAYFFIEPEQTLEYGNEALKLSVSLKSDKHIGNAYHYLALGHYASANYLQALEYNKKALEIRERLNDKLGIAKTCGNLGVIYSRLSNYPKAIESQLRALKIQEEIGDKKSMSAALGNIGNIYGDLGEKKKALDYHFRSLKLKEELGDKKGLGSCYGNIGVIYLGLREYDKSLEYQMKSLALTKELGDLDGEAHCLGNIGVVHGEKQDFSTALKYYLMTYEKAKQAEDKTLVIRSVGNIGSAYFGLGNLTLAEKYSKDALTMALEENNLSYMKTDYEQLSEIYKRKGDFEKAFEYYKSFIAIRDTIFSVDNQKLVLKNQMLSDFEREMTADSVRTAGEKKIMEAQLEHAKTRSYALYGGLALVLIFALVMFNRFRVTRKQKAIIEEQKRIVEVKQKEVLDSITYAKRIQQSLMPTEKYIEKNVSKLKEGK